MTIEERKSAFTDRVNFFRNVYPVDMINEFINYWTEHNEGGKKMRFEMEKIFNLQRRLTTWENNRKRFNGFKKPEQAEAPKVYTAPPKKEIEVSEEWLRRYEQSKQAPKENPTPLPGLGDQLRRSLFGK